LSRKVPHLVQKGQRFYFRMRVPEPLVEQYGKEVTKALGDVSKAQAAVMARQLAAEHARAPAGSSRGLLAQDEEIRIAGIRSDMGDWWRSELY
jgi:hypothetical protein